MPVTRESRKSAAPVSWIATAEGEDTLALDPQIARIAVSPAALTSRPVRYILAAVFVLDIVTTLIVFGYGNHYLIKTIEAPAAAPAFALGVYGLVKFVTAPLSGMLTDRASARLAVGLAAALQAGGAAVMLVVPNTPGFIAGIGILSAGTTLLWLLVFHAVASTVRAEDRGSATALVGIVTASGVGLGFGLAAVATDVSSTYVFASAVVLGAVSALLLWPVFPSGVASAPREQESEVDPLPPDSRPFWAASAVTFAHFFAVNATVGALGPFALDRLDLSLREVALLLTPATIAAGLAMLIAGRRSRTGRRVREAAPMYAGGAVALLVTAVLAEPVWFAVGMTFVGAAVGATTPLLNSARVDLSATSKAPGRLLGRLLFAEGLGSFIGPLAVGLVISAVDVQAGALAAGLTFALLSAMTMVASRLARL